MYGLNPNGYSYEGGKKVPVILCHQDSYQYGVGGNHSDIYHWFNKYGKTMADVRRDVAALMKGSDINIAITPSAPVSTNPEAKGYLMYGDCGSAVKTLQTMLIACGYSCGSAGIDGSFGQNTKNALIAFQRDNKLEVDGYYGIESKTALTAKYNAIKNNTSSSVQKPSVTKPTSTTKTKLTIDGSFGRLTVLASQKYLKTVQDGVVSGQPMWNKKYLPAVSTTAWEFEDGKCVGSSMVRALQKLIGTEVDGFCGKGTVTALQVFLQKKGYYKGAIDGSCGKQTVMAWQSFLNDNLK